MRFGPCVIARFEMRRSPFASVSTRAVPERGTPSSVPDRSTVPEGVAEVKAPRACELQIGELAPVHAKALAGEADSTSGGRPGRSAVSLNSALPEIAAFSASAASMRPVMSAVTVSFVSARRRRWRGPFRARQLARRRARRPCRASPRPKRSAGRPRAARRRRREPASRNRRRASDRRSRNRRRPFR